MLLKERIPQTAKSASWFSVNLLALNILLSFLSVFVHSFMCVLYDE